MKRKLPKSFFFAASLFSLFAFAFVNVNVGAGTCAGTETCLVQKVQQIQEQDAGNIQTPDITIVGRLIEVAQVYFSHE
jgi:hypothetical protein